MYRKSSSYWIIEDSKANISCMEDIESSAVVNIGSKPLILHYGRNNFLMRVEHKKAKSNSNFHPRWMATLCFRRRSPVPAYIEHEPEVRWLMMEKAQFVLLVPCNSISSRHHNVIPEHRRRKSQRKCFKPVTLFIDNNLWHKRDYYVSPETRVS